MHGVGVRLQRQHEFAKPVFLLLIPTRVNKEGLNFSENSVGRISMILLQVAKQSDGFRFVPEGMRACRRKAPSARLSPETKVKSARALSPAIRIGMKSSGARSMLTGATLPSLKPDGRHQLTVRHVSRKTNPPATLTERKVLALVCGEAMAVNPLPARTASANSTSMR